MARVLVVDENFYQRERLENLLDQINHEAVVAPTVKGAIKVLKSKDPIHLIISDHEPPRTDGLKFLRRVKSTPGLDTLPFIMCLSKEDPDAIRACEALRADVCMSGDVGIMEKIQNLLQR